MGIVLSGGYITFQLAKYLYLIARIPLLLKIGFIMVLLGALMIITKLIFERIKGGDDDDVDRKY